MDNEHFQKLVLEHLTKLNAEVTDIKTTMATKEELTSVKGEITDIKGEIADIKGEITDIKGEITDIKATMATKEELREVKQSLTKMEHDLTSKITALFDGWQQHEDYSCRFATQLERMETKIDTMDLNVTKIATMQEHHSAMLDVLSSRTTHQEAEISILKRAR